MDVLRAIAARRSVERFDPEHRMTDDELDRLIDAARLAPSAFDVQHARFVAVRDPELRREIRAVADDQPRTTEASLLIVVTGDLAAWRRDARETIASLYEHRPGLQRDEAQRSIGGALQTILLAAQALGYDSCPLYGFERDAVARLIRLPADHCMGALVAVGKRAADPRPEPERLPRDDVLVVDRFPE